MRHLRCGESAFSTARVLSQAQWLRARLLAGRAGTVDAVQLADPAALAEVSAAAQAKLLLSLLQASSSG